MITVVSRSSITALACVVVLVLPPELLVRPASVTVAASMPQTNTVATPVRQPATAPKPGQPPAGTAKATQPPPATSRVQPQTTEPDGGWPRRYAGAVDKSAIRPENTPDVKADPPEIFLSTRSAVLINLDGEPIWSPIQGVDLSYAVNTNWDLFQTPSKVLYLRNNDTWLTASSLKGPWSAAGTLPPAFAKLPSDDNWKDVRANIPGRPIPAGAVPSVFIATKPAELLLLRGAPVYQPVTGTSLLWVTNTDSDVFRLGKAGSFYYLVSGRWFSASSLNGPWTFATLQLPEDFKKIPVDIEGTTLSRAVNTDKDIVKVGDLYYMCCQAVWFVSRAPSGPWEVARSVPSQIYSIPASSPVHHVTYVTVEDDDANDARTYGSGAWYNPWTATYGRGAAAYGPFGGAGAAAVYNPRTGTYARGAAAYGPYGGRAAAQAWNPRTGTFAQTRQGGNI